MAQALHNTLQNQEQNISELLPLTIMFYWVIVQTIILFPATKCEVWAWVFWNVCNYNDNKIVSTTNT